MKLRTTHNSIRIRVRKSEIAVLHEQRRIEERIGFPGGAQFSFVLEIRPQTTPILVHLKPYQLVMTISEPSAQEWINSNQVSVEDHIPFNGDESLHVLLEKDFPCLDRPKEDQSDTFWELAPDTPGPC